MVYSNQVVLKAMGYSSLGEKNVKVVEKLKRRIGGTGPAAAFLYALLKKEPSLVENGDKRKAVATVRKELSALEVLSELETRKKVAPKTLGEKIMAIMGFEGNKIKISRSLFMLGFFTVVGSAALEMTAAAGTAATMILAVSGVLSVIGAAAADGIDRLRLKKEAKAVIGLVGELRRLIPAENSK